jgi:L-arabinonolactonase
MKMADINICVPCPNILGEGPVWDVAEQRLYWIDGEGHEIWRCAPDGSDVRTWKLPVHIGMMALRESGGAILATGPSLQFFDFETGALQPICDPEAGRNGVRLNDGKVDSRGRLIVGSLDLPSLENPQPGQQPRGTLYRLDTDLSLHRLDTGFGVSNGPCWSPDQSTFYFTDSAADRIYAYDWNELSGQPSAKRNFAEMPPRYIPDGGTVDEEGYIWSVLNGAYSGVGELRRYAPDGTLDRSVTMPVPKPTSMMFGGADLDVIFVTTMNLPTEIPYNSADGYLFTITGLGIRGLPERRFAG